MFKKEHTLFNEIYRPEKLEDYLGNESFKEKIASWIETNDIPNMLLSGPAGIGKTTAAKLIVKNLDCDWIFINASDERGIDTIREKVVGFASSATFAPLKIIILDEADFLSHLSQPALRGIIKQYSASTRFILTCNYSEKIILALKSRCPEFALSFPSKVDIANRLDYILEREGVEYDINDLKTIINKHYPDIRDIINITQISCIKGKLVLNLDDYNSNKLNNTLLEFLKNTKSKINYRKEIINSNQKDFTGLYRMLFDSLDEWCKEEYQPQILILLNQYMYNANFVPDREINISACIAAIKETLKYDETNTKCKSTKHTSG